MPEVTVEEYFTESLKEFPTQPTLVGEAKTVTFGNADDARMYVFDYEYKDHKFRTMQIFSKYDDRFGIFTFTSFRENMSSDKVTQYEYFAEKRQAIIDNFKYVKRSASHPEPEYERDADGYKLISDKSVAKYSLWVPDDFTVKYSSGITEATLADGSSITMSVATNTGVVVTEYWAARKAELEALFGTVNVISADTPTALGDSNAAFAYEYTYTYNYAKTKIGVMQILVYHGADFYIFTYSSFMEEKEYGISYYDYYLQGTEDKPSKVGSIISSFKFIDKSGEPSAPEYERDENGNIIVSDKAIAGFVMSVPDAYRVDYSSAIVSVTREDGTNISMSKATYTGVDKDAYWEHRKEELIPLIDKDESGNTTLREVEGGISVAVELDDVKWAFSYEYTYELEGKAYHVYQVLIVKGSNGYVFTYTAYEENYAEHLSEAKDILAGIKY